MSKGVTIKHTIFHHDDAKLTLEYPEDLAKVSSLTEDEIQSRFDIFGRILFDTLLDKERKEFKIIQDERTGEWVYLRPHRKTS